MLFLWIFKVQAIWRCVEYTHLSLGCIVNCRRLLLISLDIGGFLNRHSLSEVTQLMTRSCMIGVLVAMMRLLVVYLLKRFMLDRTHWVVRFLSLLRLLNCGPYRRPIIRMFFDLSVVGHHPHHLLLIALFIHVTFKIASHLQVILRLPNSSSFSVWYTALTNNLTLVNLGLVVLILQVFSLGSPGGCLANLYSRVLINDFIILGRPLLVYAVLV